jgi:tRNA(adenine34) deaminase
MSLMKFMNDKKVDSVIQIGMEQALAIAAQAVATGDVPVGAVVLNDRGEVVGIGNNLREADQDPTAHAEIIAMRQAARTQNNWRLDGHTLIVTLEPCAMCAGAIAQARIKTLVFGAWDEKAGAVGSVWDILRDPRSPHRVEVVAGVMESQCVELLQEFFRNLR